MNDYDFLKELGSGSFGRVVKVRKHTKQDEILAMKQIKMKQLNSRERDNALNEVRLLASIDSPNVISYKSAFFEEMGNTLCILMEYADGGDLAVLYPPLRVSSNRKKGSTRSSLRILSGRWPTISSVDLRPSMTATLFTEISNQLTSFLLQAWPRLEI